MKKLVNLNTVPNGGIIEFPNSAFLYMKVETTDGTVGAVALLYGEFETQEELTNRGIGPMCYYSYQDIDELYHGKD